MPQDQYFPLVGGLDQETAAIAVPPGRSIAVLNHECVSRGYQRTEGYERFDGRLRPSQARYWTAAFESGAVAIEEGDIVEGATSGATAIALMDAVLDLGGWDGTGEGSVCLGELVGTFQAGETLEVGGNPVAELVAVPVLGVVTPDDPDSQACQTAAVELRRAQITQPPGEGPVRGVLWFDGKLNAWRDNVGATAGVLHHSGAAGWTQPALGRSVAFTSGGVYVIAPGNVITGATSGATATVRYVSWVSGDWAAGTAAGYLVLDNVVGTFVAENLNVGANLNVATIAAAPANVTLNPGGRYEFVIHNFFASAGTERAYGANGVDKAFEFDGDTIVKIPTGSPDDRPFLVAEHKMHLFLGFPKGSVVHSEPGQPLGFDGSLGASEIGVGYELTNFVSNMSATLIITTEQTVSSLLGQDADSWDLQTLSDEAGAKKWTAQRVGQIVYLDDRGVRSVSATQAFGNFRLGTFTTLIQQVLNNKRVNGIKPVASIVVKSKDQYLLFYEDGSGISIYMGRKNPEAMVFTYPFTVTCYHVAEVDGVERVFVGADDGFVYELNVGTSFDGEVIEAFLQLPFGHQGGPRILKRYHKAVVELISGPLAHLAVVAQFDYGAGIQPFSHSELFDLYGSGGLWNLSNWDEFVWSAPTQATATTYLQGVGENMSLIVFSNSAVMDSYILQGVTISYSVRGAKR